MSITRSRKALALTMALPLLYLAGVAPDAPAGLALLQEPLPRTPAGSPQASLKRHLRFAYIHANSR